MCMRCKSGLTDPRLAGGRIENLHVKEESKLRISCPFLSQSVSQFKHRCNYYVEFSIFQLPIIHSVCPANFT